MKAISTLTKRVTKGRCTCRILLGAIMLLCILPKAFSQQSSQQKMHVGADSLFRFSYRPQVRMFETRLGKNSQSLKELAASLRTFRKGIDTIYIEGYSGTLGNERADRGTAFWRCINLKGYLINTKQMRERDFKTRNYPFAHEQWGEVVLLSLSPFITLPSKPVEKEDSVAIEVEIVQKETVQPLSTDASVMPEQQMVTEQQSVDLQSVSLQPSPKERYFSLKTNLAAWAGTILNVAADLQVGPHLSLELPLLWCPWYAGSRHAVRTFTLQPEARYWLSKPGMGHFIGIHAHISWFNVKWNDHRYQDPDRPLLGGGISYGYLLPLSSRWGAEFTLGAGYTNMRYDTYYNIDNGVRSGTQTKNYWGITRVGISLVYRLNGAK